MYTHTHTLGEWVKERESLDSWPGAAPVTVSFFSSLFLSPPIFYFCFRFLLELIFYFAFSVPCSIYSPCFLLCVGRLRWVFSSAQRSLLSRFSFRFIDLFNLCICCCQYYRAGNTALNSLICIFLLYCTELKLT